MTTNSAVISAQVLPRTRAVTATLIIGFAMLTAGAAQVEIPLWFTPVPITGQTLAVLLAGAVLGRNAGAASQALYVGLGAVGLPFYSGGDGGWEAATGSTAGYLVGFVVAAAVVGHLAEHRQDRSVITALPAFMAGTAIIYLFGVSGLMMTLGVGVARAIQLGVMPFVIGDLVKVALVGVALPLAWQLVDEFRHGGGANPGSPR